MEARSDEKVSLILPDLGLDKTWDLSTLPFSAFQANPTSSSDVDADTLPNATASPDPSLLAMLENSDLFAGAGQSNSIIAAHAAAQAFLYLYLRLSQSSPETSARKRKSLARTFTVRSSLPIGAGLGSSAAFSVCLASALLYLNAHMPFPTCITKTNPISVNSSHLVNTWAFVGEKILHGNPSGVDNSVSALGGALVFQKSKIMGEPPILKALHQ